MKLLKIISGFFSKEKSETDENGKQKNIKLPFVLILFFIGVLLLILPSGNKKKTVDKKSYEIDISSYRHNEEKRLNEMLSMVKGVEEAKIFITYADNGVIEVLNEEKNVWKKEGNGMVGSETQSEKKPVYNGDNDTIIKKRTAPTISGVCIFYRGDDNEKTRDRLFRAAKGALGTESHKIEIVLLK